MRYKVWIDIEELADEQGHGKMLEGPLNTTTIAEFATLREAQAFAERLVEDHGHFDCRVCCDGHIEGPFCDHCHARHCPHCDACDLPRTNCGGCGEDWIACRSDAKDAHAYCSAECEQRDEAGTASRG